MTDMCKLINMCTLRHDYALVSLTGWERNLLVEEQYSLKKEKLVTIILIIVEHGYLFLKWFLHVWILEFEHQHISRFWNPNISFTCFNPSCDVIKFNNFFNLLHIRNFWLWNPNTKKNSFLHIQILEYDEQPFYMFQTLL